MRENYSKFEEWIFISLILFSVWNVFGGFYLFGVSETFDGNKAGFTIGLVMLLVLGTLCLFVSRFHSKVAFWLLFVTCLPFVVSIPVIILWNIFPLFLTLTYLILVLSYFKGFSFILLDVDVELV